jgi:glycosyltransferase involved in cell wall biosynthesis
LYLVAIHVPIYTRGKEYLLATDWKRSLLLLRDSFNGRFGRIQVVAPSLNVKSVKTTQRLECVGPSEEIDLFPSFPHNTRARDFWGKHIYTWYRDVSSLLQSADVVHAGFCDVYRPINFVGFLLGHSAGKPTVFVQDTDQVLQIPDLCTALPLLQRWKMRVYCMMYERCVRYGVARATLSLLKGRALNHRYGPIASNPKNFHDTSFMTTEVVSSDILSKRTEELLKNIRPIRLVYCGRLETRKGIEESLEALMRARLKGARVTLDIIGDGGQRKSLENQAANLGVSSEVKFHGSRVYGPKLLADLSNYDAMFFTPIAEDTPRMIFDGYAAGLPLLAYGIEYVREREAEEGAARSVPMRDLNAVADLLCEIDSDRKQLVELTKRAHQAAFYHSADSWYRRRAEWTFEAVANYRHRTCGS